MILNHLKAYPIYFYGATSNTGDGIRMAQAVGADLWHMNQMIGRAVGHFTHPDGREMSFNISVNPPGDRKSVVSGKRVSVRVDLGGRRTIKKKNSKPNIE